MKTIPALAFIAALAAFLVLPLSFAFGGSVLFTAGLVAIAFSDYTRKFSGVRMPVTTGATRGRSERLRLAA